MSFATIRPTNSITPKKVMGGISTASAAHAYSNGVGGGMNHNSVLYSTTINDNDKSSTSSSTTTVFPQDVISYIQEQTKSIDLSPEQTISVPTYMEPDQTLLSANLRDAPMIKLHFGKKSSATATSVKEIDVLRSREMIQRHTGKYGSICFVIRRPGCCLCREQAMTLSALATLYESHLEGFNIFGIVKEIGVDDEGLSEFYHDYCVVDRFPMYVDKSYSFYHALGDRKGMEIPSLWTWTTSFFDAWNRINRKGIKGNDNNKGEGTVKGGIILLDTKGRPRYAQVEKTGHDLDIQGLVLAMEAIRRDTA